MVFGFYSWRQASQKSRASGEASLRFMENMESSGAPPFEAESVFKREKFKLESLKGQFVILNFWASWCGPCIEEIPSLTQLVQHFRGQIHLVAVSNDSSREQMVAFLKAFPQLQHDQIHLVWDPSLEIAQKYGVQRLPESFILDRDLKLKKKVIGSIVWFNADSKSYFEELLGTSP